MLLLSNFSSDARQSQTVVLQDGTSFSMTLYYNVNSLGFFIQSLTYGSFTLNSFRVTNSPNMLNAFSNQIPFGLCVTTVDGREPTQILDFSSGNATMYVLSQTECVLCESLLQGGS
jgi:hypothetical protein